MSQLPILIFPDPKLRKVAEPVTVFDADVQKLASDMLETMYKARGVGLAAPQVSVLRRLIVIDVSESHNEALTLVNPVVTAKRGEQQREEGCLSFPGYYELVRRPEQISISAQDTAGRSLQMDVEGLLAICIQHECEHLDGRLFVDHISRLKRARIQQKLLKEYNRR